MKKEHSNLTKLAIMLGLVAIFVVGLVLVVTGQKTVGYKNLGMMVLGLSMLLSLIYLYNKKYNV